MNYYGAFYRSALYLLGRVIAYLLRWVPKFRRLGARRKAHSAWNSIPRFFAHWTWTTAIPQVWSPGRQEPAPEGRIFARRMAMAQGVTAAS